MILPLRRGVAMRAMMAYAGLRPLKTRLGRLLLAGLVGVGLPLPARRIVLEESAPGGRSPDTIVRQLRERLGREIDVAMHLRRTANRKALLQVMSMEGETLGFAKLARNEVTAAGIRVETSVLSEFDGGSGLVRTPRVLASGECNGLPFVMTEPLPASIRAVPMTREGAPSASEFAAVSPVTGAAAPAETGHIRRMRERLVGLRAEGLDGLSLDLVAELLDDIRRFADPMPVAKRWHGDFAYWNVGRSPDGTLWCWDFENVEPDALAGLDVIHWHASRRRSESGVIGVADRDGILSDSAKTLRAFAITSPPELHVLYQTYLAEIALRTLEMAAADGWGRVWTSESELAGLISAGRRV